ncbi:MAG: trehalase family glycosidase [Acidobacteriota bacterium]
MISALALWRPSPARTQQANPPSPQPIQQSAQQPAQQSAQLAERVLIGAYDADQVNGLVFVTSNQNPFEQNLFGLRFMAYRQTGDVEESPRSFDLGPHAPDGSYARVSWQPQFDPKLTITLRWSRVGTRLVIGQLSASANVRVAVEAYRPRSAERDGLAWASYAAQSDRRAILGEQMHNQRSKPPLRRFLWRADRAGLEAANYNDQGSLRAMLAKGMQPDAQLPALRSVITFELGPNTPLGFVATIGDDPDAMQKDAETLMQKPVAELMNKAESDFEANRTLSGGALGDSLEAMTRATMWNRFYWPGQRSDYVTMHRHTGSNSPGMRGDALGWDSLLVTAMTGMTNGASATASLRILLAGQTPDGRVPLRRYLQTEPVGEPPVLTGRSMPPLGALCTLKVYTMTQDLSFLAWAYSRLQQWNDWWLADRGDGQAWRDGNKDGLLEWGFDADVEYGAPGTRMLGNADKGRMAFAESGFADRPQWLDTGKAKAAASQTSSSVPPTSTAVTAPEQPSGEVKYNDRTHTLEFSSVALNSLYALDTELMLTISREIGLTADGERWQRRYDQVKRLMNEKLWSEEDGLYLDRHWDGRFSRRITLENFYPLLAGIPDEAKAKRMLAVLRDQRRFGGLLLLPSVPRDDAAFVEKASEQTATTGATHAAMNYLLYLGLKRYGFYDEAEGLARQSLHAARAAYEKQGEGERSAGATGALFDLFASTSGQPVEQTLAPSRASFAGLMFLPAVEELISADPWLGITIGSLIAPEEARVERVKIADENLDVMIGPKRTVVRRGDKVEIEFEAPIRLRSYRSTDSTLTFVVEAKAEVRALVPPAEGRKVTVSVNDKVLGSTSPGASASFKVKEGLSKVLIVR